MIYLNEQKRILENKFRQNILGYAEHFKKETGETIPNDYLEEQLEVSVGFTLKSQDFLDALADDPIESWEDDWFREFLFEICTICEDYPM